MTSASMDLSAGAGAAVAWLVAALALVGLLIGAFAFGIRVRNREEPPPRPEDQTRMPEGGPVHEVRENREPYEMPLREDRALPYELRHQGSRTAAGQDRPRWGEGNSGGFGSGGPGHAR